MKSDIDIQLFFEHLKKNAKLFFFKKNDIIFRQGEPVTGLYFIDSGLARVSQLDSNNKIVFTRLVLPQDTVGHRSIFIEKTYSGSVEVISEELTAYFFNTEEVMALLATNQEFARYLIVKISYELQRSEQARSDLKEKTARERVAGFLLFIAQKYSEAINKDQFVFKSEISKTVIAHSLLMADETVIRIMTEFRLENVISYNDKRIVIPDIKKLADAAKMSF